MKKFTNIAISMVAVSMLFSSCATTELQTASKMTQTLFISPVKQELKTIFISSKNTSGQNINLEASLKNELITKGYKVVDDPEIATYILMTNVLFVDKKQENNASGAALGAGVIGAGVGGYNSSHAGTMVAAGVGAAILGGLLGKATEDTIYQMQVDVLVKERNKSSIYTTSSNLAGQAVVRDGQKAGFMNTHSGTIKDVNASGKLASNMSNEKIQSYEDEYKEQKTIVYAEATKMDLSLEEATPILEKQIANQISGLF